MRARSLVLGGAVVALGIALTATAQPARQAAAVVPERELAVNGARMLIATRRIRPREARGLVPALERAYDRMERVAGRVPTPLPASLVGLDGALGVEPPGDGPAESGVVFLHGFGGCWAAPCWHVAHAMRSARPVTLCPSIGPEGDWWTAEGGATVDRALDALHARGIERVYLAGLSNGAIGAATHAPSRVDRLDGLVLLSGTSTGAPPPRIPVFALHARGDTMTPFARTRRYVRRAGRRGTFVELPGNHFAFLDRYDHAERAIARWVASSGPGPEEASMLRSRWPMPRAGSTRRSPRR